MHSWNPKSVVLGSIEGMHGGARFPPSTVLVALGNLLPSHDDGKHSSYKYPIPTRHLHLPCHALPNHASRNESNWLNLPTPVKSPKRVGPISELAKASFPK